ncbi:MAG: twin-arginine translocase TatA/TatE family subunit [Opitutae bacterium]|nr:twin-arginine translocase TatA/TatE family subunit [Opitutae bacterium]
MEGLGGPEVMMILFVILLLFGANKLPELARGLGKSVKEFKKAASDVEYQIKEAMEEKREQSEEAKRFAPKPVTPGASSAEQPKTFPPYPPGATPPAKSAAAIAPSAPSDAAPPANPPPETPKA